MARTQVLTSHIPVAVPVPGTAVSLDATSGLYVKSVLIQALATNTDFMYIGDSLIQNYALSPGKSVEIHGDNMDNGTSGKLQLASIYVNSVVAGESVTIMYLVGL